MSDTPGLALEDLAKLILPARVYYPHKIAKERKRGEPELDIIGELVDPARMAIDIGANRGSYAYAMRQHTSRVEAFEPFPPMARFASRMLGRRVNLHQIALSDTDGTTRLHVPIDDETGRALHLISSIRKQPACRSVAVDVETRTLDSYGFEDVGFIKIDVEGAEEQVLAGGRSTIVRDRPTMLIELLTDATADPDKSIHRIESEFDYEGCILADGELQNAHAVLARHQGPDWTRNIVFRPRSR